MRGAIKISGAARFLYRPSRYPRSDWGESTNSRQPVASSGKQNREKDFTTESTEGTGKLKIENGKLKIEDGIRVYRRGRGGRRGKVKTEKGFTTESTEE